MWGVNGGAWVGRSLAPDHCLTTHLLTVSLLPPSPTRALTHSSLATRRVFHRKALSIPLHACASWSYAAYLILGRLVVQPGAPSAAAAQTTEGEVSARLALRDADGQIGNLRAEVGLVVRVRAQSAPMAPSFAVEPAKQILLAGLRFPRSPGHALPLGLCELFHRSGEEDREGCH